MRISQLLTTTLREVPRESEGVNQELLVRAGFVRQLTSGVYSFLPLGTGSYRRSRPLYAKRWIVLVARK
ncbi:hypothetical protein [Dictyobacter kobayashii]|uniref:Prolyl-tRNA synthetase n=1 Tax=Dictyobacter kobayashii TaxID=2014872 RepID=A0A402AEU3_9CHLR|nr:hypothetical protein [Dictyobacter kobayashii]GCE17615.1 hypothetical protein KDK_14150 [Dictyobacter kobayashii]